MRRVCLRPSLSTREFRAGSRGTEIASLFGNPPNRREEHGFKRFTDSLIHSGKFVDCGLSLDGSGAEYPSGEVSSFGRLRRNQKRISHLRRLHMEPGGPKAAGGKRCLGPGWHNVEVDWRHWS